MKQNNYEHIAIFDANASSVASERLRAKQQQSKQHRLLTYSSVVAVSALALLSSAILLPFMKPQDLDPDVLALNESKTTVTSEATAQMTERFVVNSKLADRNNLFPNYGTEAMHRSNAEQERALLYLLHKTAQTDKAPKEEVLKVKELEWNGKIKSIKAKQPEPTQTVTPTTQPSQLAVTPTTVVPEPVATTVQATEAVASQVKPNIRLQLQPKSLAPNSDRSRLTAPKPEEEHDEFATELTDRELMYYIVMAETGYADTDSISLVAQIIVNRTKVFNESLRSVLTAPDQFSCYANGSYKKNAPTARVKQICDAALAGAPMGQYVLPHDVIFYCTVNYYLTRPSFFVSLKKILKHNTQVFFAPSTSSSQPMDDWELPASEAEEEEHEQEHESKLDTSETKAPLVDEEHDRVVLGE